MKINFPNRLRTGVLLGGLASLIGIVPVLAQDANFGPLTLGSNSPSDSADGFTAGFYALSNIAGRDRNGNICVGFADTTPDHIMVLQQDFPSLTVQVNSGGNDTALLIQGPDNNTIRCGKDIDRRNLDEQIQDTDWAAGTYRIWVGAQDQGQRYNYTITANP